MTAIFSGAALLIAATMNAALGGWLPKADTGFIAWKDGTIARTTTYDYFVCGETHAPVEHEDSFYYAGSGCPALEHGTRFSFGGGEPTTGQIVDDPKHDTILFDAGCCAWRGFVLTSGTGVPPVRTAQYDLGGVTTNRGVRLGMTSAQVMHLYGPAVIHKTAARQGLATLSYTTLKGGPNNSLEACGQWQSFFFHNDKLVSIELLAGC